MAVGLTINQGANTNEIVALKSSVTHAMTSPTEADTYATFKKAFTTAGLEIAGYNSGGSGFTTTAISISGNTTTEDTTDSTNAAANVYINGNKDNAAGSVAAIGTTANLFVVGNNGVSKMLVKGNGDFHVKTLDATNSDSVAAVALDDYVDAELIRTFEMERSGGLGAVMTKWDDQIQYNKQSLIDVGVLSETGRFTSVQRMQSLMGGAIWQGHTNHMSLVEEVASLKQQLLALTSAE